MPEVKLEGLVGVRFVDTTGRVLWLCPRTGAAGHNGVTDKPFRIAARLRELQARAPDVVCAVPRPLAHDRQRSSVPGPLDFESLTTKEATMERQQPIRMSIVDQYCEAELDLFPISHRCGLKRGHSGPHFSGKTSWVRVNSEDPAPSLPTWWLSFADPNKPKGEQFLGVVLVDADSFMAAHFACTVAGVNPGGEVQGHSAEGAPPEELERLAKAPKLTLLSFQQLTNLGFKLGRPNDVDDM